MALLLITPRLLRALTPPLPLPMWAAFISRCQCHMWVEFVVGFLLCSERFFSRPGTPVFPSPQKPTSPNSKLTRNQEDYLRKTVYLFVCFFIYSENNCNDPANYSVWRIAFFWYFFIVSKGFCRHCSQRYLLGQVVFNSTLVIIYYIQTTQTLYFNSKHHLFFSENTFLCKYKE